MHRQALVQNMQEKTIHLQGMAVSERGDGIRARYQRFDRKQTELFDEVPSSLEQRRRSDTTGLNVKLFPLPGRAGAGNTYALSLLCDMQNPKVSWYR